MELLVLPQTWVTVSFVLFILIVIFKGKSILLSALDQHIAKATRELDEAYSLREEAMKLLAESARAERDAETQAQNILREAVEYAEVLTRNAEVDVKLRISRLEALSHERIRMVKERALHKIRQETAEQTTEAIRLLLTKRRDQQSEDATIEQSIDAIRERLQ